jgi:hypothetical protein
VCDDERCPWRLLLQIVECCLHDFLALVIQSRLTYI